MEQCRQPVADLLVGRLDELGNLRRCQKSVLRDEPDDGEVATCQLESGWGLAREPALAARAGLGVARSCMKYINIQCI